MWSPAEIFFIVWHCNFAPTAEARLSVDDVLKAKEHILIQRIVKDKEDQIIRNTIRLRDDLESR